MERKDTKDIDLDELKRQRKAFKEQTEEEDLNLQTRIQKTIDGCEMLGVRNTRLRMMLEDSVHEMRRQRQRLLSSRDDFLDHMDRRIRTLEDEKEELRRKERDAAQT
jgi:predicted transcriptional regulator|uniref:Uncharacterized protein n=1 Tax=Eubacterium cellulosolvens (strain ATCC 43171 / JCM 9499 / 6) TaxID=633697 RepID=I5AQ35_EUBC6